MGLIVQALTSDDDQEIEGLLKVRRGGMHAFSAIGVCEARSRLPIPMR